MLTALTVYAVDKGLPYDFVEWALDRYGYEVDPRTDLDAIARDWQSATP